MEDDKIFVKIFNTQSPEPAIQQITFAKNCLEWARIYMAGTMFSPKPEEQSITKFAERMFSLAMYQTAEVIYNQLNKDSI